MGQKFPRQFAVVLLLGVVVSVLLAAVFLLRSRTSSSLAESSADSSASANARLTSLQSSVLRPFLSKKQGKFELYSDTVNIGIDFLSETSGQELEALYEELGVWKPEGTRDLLARKQGRTIIKPPQVERVRVTIVSQIPEDVRLGNFYGYDEGYSYSFKFTGDNSSVMEVYLQLSEVYRKSADDEQIARALSSMVYEIGYVTTRGAVRGILSNSASDYIQFRDRAEEIYKVGPSYFSVKKNNFKITLVKQAYAVTCSGSVQYGAWQSSRRCSGNTGRTCSANTDCSILGWGTCDLVESCTPTRSGTCYNLDRTECFPDSETESSSCIVSNTCARVAEPSNGCSSGQIFCGGCVNGCRSNSQTCNAWIAAECGGGGSGGGGTVSCTWCTSQSECPGNWEGSGSSWCNAPLGGCCVGGGGGDGGGEGPPPPPPCYPSCGNACGQGDGCGGRCPDTDQGTPGSVTISSPTQGEDFKASATNKVLINWPDASKADAYNIQYYPTFNPGGIDLTTPYGALSGDAVGYSAAYRQRAFDTSVTTAWVSSQKGPAVSGTAWIGHDFGASVNGYRQIGKITITQYNNANYQIDSVRVQYSDNLTDWTTAATQAIAKNGTKQEFTIPASGAHRAWRLLANGNPGGATTSWGVVDIDFMIDGPVVPAQSAGSRTSSYELTAASREYTVRVRPVNDTCSYEVSSWSPYVSFYVSSPVSGTVFLDSDSSASLTGSVCTGPTDSVNTSGGDVTSAAGAISGGNINATTNNAQKAFDNNAATGWGSSQRGTAISGNAWIGQDFGSATDSARHIRKIVIRQHSNINYDVNSVFVEFSDDGSNWTNHQTLAIGKNGSLNTYVIESSSPHRYWRLRANQNLTATYYWIVMELEMRELEGGDVGSLTVSGSDWQNYSEEVAVDQSGTYSVHVPYSATGTNRVSLNISNGQFICSCPIGCVYGGVQAPLAGLNFYVTDAQHPWFQIVGGSIVAYQNGGTAVNNPIPTTCLNDAACKPYLILQKNGADTSGYVLTGGGDVDLRFGVVVEDDLIDEDQKNRLGKVTSRASQERFEHFARLYKLPFEPQNDFGGSTNNIQEPTGTPANAGVDAYYQSGDVTIEDPWSIESGESRVIFIDGTLTIKNTINVAEGGFLAFIVKKDILVDPSVGHEDVTNNTPLVEGMYIANGQIRFPSAGVNGTVREVSPGVFEGGDLKFVGAGTFVGWGGIAMERDFDDGVLRRQMNNENPTELFIYRPDLVLNTPARMRSPRYQWREVNP